MFKKMRSIGLSYKKQGLIYFTCKNYADQPAEIQQKIDQLCLQVGGDEYYQALRRYLIFDCSLQEMAVKYNCDATTLWRKKMKFYEGW
jgi:hypothetical protein